MSERLDEISVEGGDSISWKDLLKYIKSILEGLSLRNMESLKKIIEDNSYSGNKMKMLESSA